MKTIVEDMLAAPENITQGDLLGACQKYGDLLKWLVGPSVGHSDTPVGQLLYNGQSELRRQLHTMVAGFTSKRLPAASGKAINSMMRLDKSWICSEDAYLVLGVHASPKVYVIACDSFFGLFRLYDRLLTLIAVVIPNQITDECYELFESRIQEAMTRAPYPEHWEAVKVYYFDALLIIYLCDVREWYVLNLRTKGVPGPELYYYLAMEAPPGGELPTGLNDIKKIWKRIEGGESLGVVLDGAIQRARTGKIGVAEGTDLQHDSFKVESLDPKRWMPFKAPCLDKYVKVCEKHSIEVCCPYMVATAFYPKSDEFPYGIAPCSKGTKCRLRHPRDGVANMQPSARNEIKACFSHFGRKGAGGGPAHGGGSPKIDKGRVRTPAGDGKAASVVGDLQTAGGGGSPGKTKNFKGGSSPGKKKKRKGITIDES